MPTADILTGFEPYNAPADCTICSAWFETGFSRPWNHGERQLAGHRFIRECAACHAKTRARAFVASVAAVAEAAAYVLKTTYGAEVSDEAVLRTVSELRSIVDEILYANTTTGKIASRVKPTHSFDKQV